MTDPGRSLRRRRDAGLAKVGTWTRTAIGAGVVFSGVLAGGFAHVLPGQAASTPQMTPTPSTAAPSATAPSPGTPSGTAPTPGDHSTEPRRPHGHRLTPPATPPHPARHTSPHATSGGS
jgi:hypothetical protein